MPVPAESLTKITRGANYMIDPRMRQYFPEPYSDYKRMRELGRGQYGAVYLAEHKPTRVKVALKIVNEIDDMEAFNLIALRLAKGSDTPLKMRQNHIVPILATGLLPDGRVFIVSELMDGSLSTLQDASAGRLVRGMRDILLGVRYIHSIGMVHNDLHSANILHKRGEFFIGDFGLACTMYPIKNMVMKECLLTRRQWVLASFLDVYRATGSFFYSVDDVIEAAAPSLAPALDQLEKRYVRWDDDRNENVIVKGAYDEGAPKYVDEALLIVQRHLDKVAALQYN
jgi:serine/threonine protein kinase